MNYNDNNNNIKTNICKADSVSSQNCVGGTCVKMLVFQMELESTSGLDNCRCHIFPFSYVNLMSSDNGHLIEAQRNFVVCLTI